MQHELTPVIAILGGGLLAVAISRMTNVTEIVCYFVAGALLGDYGFAIVHNSHSLHVLAEVGLAFFLFEVGSHLSVKKLRAEWRTFLTLGPVHAFVTGGVIALVAYALGVPVHLAALLGAILSLSSTAVVLKLLENEGEAESPSARSATAVLLFQDVLAVVLLAILPALAQGDAATLPWEIGKVLGASVVAATGVVAIARFVLRPFYRWVFAQRAEEVFTAAALLTVLLIASFVQPLGLSLPLGAFLAGVAISETNYSYIIRAEV
ncbi:MAG: cation:proton antiporter, partial [Deltaproteobacteria bacterium]|nr:cation:proton antiporter [Deltaproteobacteria bacterium]